MLRFKWMSRFPLWIVSFRLRLFVWFTFQTFQNLTVHFTSHSGAKSTIQMRQCFFVHMPTRGLKPGRRANNKFYSDLWKIYNLHNQINVVAACLPACLCNTEHQGVGHMENGSLSDFLPPNFFFVAPTGFCWVLSAKGGHFLCRRAVRYGVAIDDDKEKVRK